MKWLILILLSKGNPLVLDHRPFETEDECIAYVSDYNNAEEFAVEVIAHAGFNVRVIDLFCITNQERKTYATIQKL